MQLHFSRIALWTHFHPEFEGEWIIVCTMCLKLLLVAQSVEMAFWRMAKYFYFKYFLIIKFKRIAIVEVTLPVRTSVAFPATANLQRKPNVRMVNVVTWMFVNWSQWPLFVVNHWMVVICQNSAMERTQAVRPTFLFMMDTNARMHLKYYHFTWINASLLCVYLRIIAIKEFVVAGHNNANSFGDRLRRIRHPNVTHTMNMDHSVGIVVITKQMSNTFAVNQGKNDIRDQ